MRFAKIAFIPFMPRKCVDGGNWADAYAASPTGAPVVHLGVQANENRTTISPLPLTAQHLMMRRLPPPSMTDSMPVFCSLYL